MRANYLYLWLSALLLVPAGLGLVSWPALAEPQKDPLYQEARKDLDAGRFNAAADKFGKSAAKGGKDADAALYWKAYAQKKAGKSAEALTTLRQLASAHPRSAWQDDAKALEIEIRGAAGQRPDPGDEVDDETKLYALNGLMASGSKQALPLILKFLDGPHSAHLKGQALFVLTQSDSPEARRTLLEVARGTRHPELQRQAIESLGAAGDAKTLAEIYGVSTPAVKLAILDGYMAANAREQIIAAARGEKDPAVRRKALDMLGPLGARQELRQLYRDVDPAARMQILDGLAVAGDVEALSGIARDEKEPGPLRRKAISGLGISHSQQATAALRSLYTGSGEAWVRQAAIEGLFIQNNAKALIELYRAEKDPRMRREIVQKLSLMSSPEAEAFLLKIFGE
jgi:HEAT repeat protein